MNYKEQYLSYLNFFEQSLTEYFDEIKLEIPNQLFSAMEYSVVGSGKRVRPILCYATGEMLGLKKEDVKFFALAIEFIQSYSLIHDDLPSMDNDDYRRGKLSTHKKFGEAVGILTGDALLNLATEVVLEKPVFNSQDALALKTLLEYSGAKGMIKGQIIDILNENNDVASESVLNEMYINKTSKLLTASILISSILANNLYFDELKEFGFCLGKLFQITDDILDETGDLSVIGKTPHKDKDANKLTSIKVYGFDGAKETAVKLYDNCKKILSKIPNSEFLMEFTDNIFNRKK